MLFFLSIVIAHPTLVFLSPPNDYYVSRDQVMSSSSTSVKDFKTSPAAADNNDNSKQNDPAKDRKQNDPAKDQKTPAKVQKKSNSINSVMKHVQDCKKKFEKWTKENESNLQVGQWIVFIEDQDTPVRPPNASKEEAMKDIRQVCYCGQYGLVKGKDVTVPPDRKHEEGQFRYFPSIEHGTTNSKSVFKGNNALWYIQEKIDGSQTSFSIVGSEIVFYCKSSRKVYEKEDDLGLFKKMMDMIRYKFKTGVFNKNLTIHGECVQDLRHSSNTYDRTPSNFFIVYDIQDNTTGRWFSASELKAECDRIGLEATACLYQNTDEKVHPFTKAQELIKLIEEGKLQSCLGGVPEGVVVKHPAYVREQDGRQSAMKFKFVSRAFKENRSVKKIKSSARISPTEYLEWIGSMYDVQPRFHKAKQRAKELNDGKTGDGTLEQQMINDLDKDLLKERKEEIETYIWSHFSNRLISCLKKNKETLFEKDPVMIRLRRLGPEYRREDVVAEFLPDVCRYARKSFVL